MYVNFVGSSRKLCRCYQESSLLFPERKRSKLTQHRPSKKTIYAKNFCWHFHDHGVLKSTPFLSRRHQHNAGAVKCVARFKHHEGGGGWLQQPPLFQDRQRKMCRVYWCPESLSLSQIIVSKLVLKFSNVDDAAIKEGEGNDVDDVNVVCVTTNGRATAPTKWWTGCGGMEQGRDQVQFFYWKYFRLPTLFYTAKQKSIFVWPANWNWMIQPFRCFT